MRRDASAGPPGRGEVVVQVALAIAALAVFSRAVGFGFVQYDDPTYVTENARVLAGATWDGIVWAFTSTATGNWHPLTWLSLMLDMTLGGGAPSVFHATNVLLHLLNTLLLFRLLASATGATGPSALVAALFAVHPLHVESVVWVAERKDVLSTCFILLTLHAYLRHARRPRARTYVCVLVLFASSLLAKPMGVTLPALLLLLDFWPLGRIAHGPDGVRDMRPRVVEKIPLFALSAISSVVTLVVQSGRGAVGGFEILPAGTRVANAIVAYATYLVRTVWPAGLAIPYPYDLERLTAGHVFIAGAVLAAITVAALRTARTRPYLAVGWFWFVISLLPVIGLVQVGAQSMADRYTYVPLVGIFIVVAWGGRDLVAASRLSTRARTSLTAGFVAIALAALGARAHVQVAVWRDTATLFENALRVTGPNAVAQVGLGLVLQGQGRVEEAIEHYREALRVSPGHIEARANLGAALIAAGRFEESARVCEEVLALKRGDAVGHACLGAALLNQGRTDEAVVHLDLAVRRAPDNFSAHANLGLALSRQGKDDEALVHLVRAAWLRPGDAAIEVAIGTILLRRGELERAAGRFTNALEIEPGNLASLRNLGVLRARQGRIPEAIRYFEEALRRDPTDEATRHNMERARTLAR